MADTAASNLTFDPISYLARAGVGRRIIDVKPNQTFFAQGDPADSVFYLQSGRAKLTVVSHQGKEATITLLSSRRFRGRRVPRGSAWTAPGHGHRDRHVHWRSGLEGRR